MLLRTLGELSLEGSTFGRHKPLLVLAYLAIQGPTARSRLASLFWPEARDPRDSLSTTLRRLNRLAPDLVDTQGELVSTTVRCDAIEFLNNLDDSGMRYGGPFLNGLDIDLHEEAEEWLWSTRERIAEHVRRARLAAAAVQLELGHRTEARRLAESCLDIEFAPAWQHLDLLELSRILRNTDSSRLAQLQHEATFSGPSSPGPDAGNLPAAADTFIGRSAEMKRIQLLFLQEKSRLVTLHGTGGIGKSRLALEAAHTLLHSGDFPDGAWVVPLETARYAADLPAALAEALRLPAPVSVTMEQHVLRNIGSRQLLLVLDNFEHLLPHVGFLADLLRTCPHVRLLVTSRLLLHLTEEHVLAIDGLPTGSDALKLLRTRMEQRAAPGSDSDYPAMQICELVAGQPLAIELAAAQARFTPLARIADELHNGFSLLVNRDPTVPERQRSVHAALDISWRLLSQHDRQALARISVFKDGFTQEAAAYLAADSDCLDRLAQAALLRADSAGRFRLHPLVREYAARQLAGQPEAPREARTRHARFYVDMLRLRASEAFGGPGTVAFHQQIHDEMDNIRQAWHTAMDRRWWRDLAQACLPLGKYSVTRGDYAECAQLCEAAANALEASGEAGDNASSLGLFLGTLAYPTGRMGQNEKSVELCDRAMELLGDGAGSDVWGVWAARQAGAFACMALQQPGRALELALANTRLVRPDDSAASGLIWDISTGVAHQVAAYLYYMGGNYQDALDCLNEADERMRRHQAPFYTYSFWTMGMILLQLGELDEARRWLEDGLDYAQHTGIRNQVGQVQLELGRTCLAAGELVEATERAREALDFGLITSDVWLEQDAEALLGLICLEQERYTAALQHFRKSIQLTTEYGIYALGTQALLGLARQQALAGRPGWAVRLLSFVNSGSAAPVPARETAADALEKLQHQLPPRTYREEAAAGADLTPKEAFHLAMQLASGRAAVAGSHRRRP